ncbi:TPA: hypothetical protein ACJ2X1_001093 [Yersinia enterocolitica]|uniref:Uncharacterized protein n=1 Tax=Hafnia alvei TaxID=569 RepID=A0A1C6YYA4_HAFAL|nr:hypothetical protein [Hafnia alvei]NLS52720.1 hypothetical protein [Hafnia alvei]SCM51781.1 hypothetical protein BN1044_01249 [Hafnia alvei]
MFSFRNETTGMFFGMSLQIYSDMFNLADEETQRVIYTKVMDPEFINSFIGLAIIMAEKCFRDSVWKKNAEEKLAEVDFREVKQALFKTHYEVLAESL